MHQVFISSYAQNTLQRLAHLRLEGERDGPKLPDCSPVFFIILLLLLLLSLLLLLFFVRCNSQTTQATELTQKRLQIAPPILITFHIKKDTRHVRLEFQGTATVSYSTRHRNSTKDSK